MVCDFSFFEKNMNISIIVSKNKHNLIGIDNSLPWHLPRDLRYFRATTMGCTLIMGRKTASSILNNLDGRNCIVLTHNQYYYKDKFHTVNTIEKALEKAKEFNKDIFIIGGADIYEQFLPLVNNLYITKVFSDAGKDKKPGYVYFPEIDMSDWELVDTSTVLKDDFNDYQTNYLKYIRIQKA